MEHFTPLSMPAFSKPNARAQTADTLKEDLMAADLTTVM
jgi:hypothetical protein